MDYLIGSILNAMTNDFLQGNSAVAVVYERGVMTTVIERARCAPPTASTPSVVAKAHRVVAACNHVELLQGFMDDGVVPCWDDDHGLLPITDITTGRDAS